MAEKKKPRRLARAFLFGVVAGAVATYLLFWVNKWCPVRYFFSARINECLGPLPVPAHASKPKNIAGITKGYNISGPFAFSIFRCPFINANPVNHNKLPVNT